jgi:hypothetical protein
LINRRQHSCVPDVQSFRKADYHADHYLVVAKVRERLGANKRIMHRFHMEKFDLKQLNKVMGQEQCCVEISNRFAALKNLRH